MTVFKRAAADGHCRAGAGPRNLLLGLAALLLSGCAPDHVVRSASEVHAGSAASSGSAAPAANAARAGKAAVTEPATDPGNSLRQAFAPYFLLGTALSAQQIAGQERGTLPLVQQHFNSLTAENVMKWQLLQPVEGQFDFSDADALLALAEQQGSVLIGHTLLWHEQTPAWVFQGPDGGPASRELLLTRLTSHIQTVMGRYRGKIKGWDVVNEALNEDGSLRDTPWRRILGDDFYLTAFALAQQADPAAELYYNDFNLFKPAKRQGAVRLVRQLQAAGIKVAGIGMQGHYGLDFPALQEVEDSIRAFAATGAQVMITELDITVLPNPEQAQIGADVSQKLALQARLNPYTAGLPADVSQALTDRYHALFQLFLQYEASISRVTLWGVHDGQSWRNGFPMQGRTDYALLFDRDLTPKPAVTALLQLAAESGGERRE